MEVRLILTVALLLSVAVPATAEMDVKSLDWISSLPGVKLISAQDSGAQVRRMYLAQSTADAMEKVRAELQKRGWHVSPVGGPQVALASLEGPQGKLSMSVVMQSGVVNGGNMMVWVYEVGATGNPGTGPRRVSVHMIESDLHDGTLKASQQRGSYHLSGPLTVFGSGNELALTGTCSKLIINGDNNHISGACKYKDIVINGRNNKIEWLYSSNPKPPIVDNNGSDNTIEQQ